MKRHLSILVTLALLVLITGCKKKSFDPASMGREDFIGSWIGSISTFKNNQLMKESGTVVIYADAGGNSLSGILFMKETSVFHEFQFVNGTVYFRVVNNDPGSPFCQNWSLSGYMVFGEEGKIDIKVTGNECGQVGNEFVNWSGTLATVTVPPESVRYYDFAKPGNKWAYTVKVDSGDSCVVQKEISVETTTYLFSGAISQTCGWVGQNTAFKWNVTPDAFTVVNDSTICNRTLTFPINAKLGVTYNTYFNNDTATVSLLDTSLLITTPAGTFSCSRFRYTEQVYSSNLRTVKTAYLWLNNRYGIIKQEVVNPPTPADIKSQVLMSKNF